MKFPSKYILVLFIRVVSSLEISYSFTINIYIFIYLVSFVQSKTNAITYF